MIEKMIKKGHNKTNQGFGLIEVLISAAILIVILGALVAIGRMALANIRISQERAQATYLAQEGLEVARQIRDTNWVDGLNNTQWNSFIYNGELADGQTPDMLPSGAIITDEEVTVELFQKPELSGWPHYFVFQSENSGSSETINIDDQEFDRCLTLEQTGGLMPVDNSLPANEYSSGNYHSLIIRAKIYWPSNDSCDKGSRKMVEATELLTDWRPNF